MESCPGCFHDPRSMNDKYKQAVIDAKILSNEQQKKVSVYIEGFDFKIEAFTDTIPAGTREIITPDRGPDPS